MSAHVMMAREPWLVLAGSPFTAEGLLSWEGLTTYWFAVCGEAALPSCVRASRLGTGPCPWTLVCTLYWCRGALLVDHSRL